MALMSGPSYGGISQMSSDKQERRINVHFRIPFMTKWGQSIVVAGTGVEGLIQLLQAQQYCRPLMLAITISVCKLLISFQQL